MEKQFLTYEEFGAKGDGKSNDLPAIVLCHEEANKCGLPVKANPEATYYLGGNNITAIIKTDTDFGTAKFIIDDRNVEDRNAKIFRIQADGEVFTPDIKTLAKGQTKMENPYGAKVFMRIFYSGKKRFIRKGANMNNGADTSDCIVVDKDGTILTSVDWDYPEITSACAKMVDDTPITVKGGIFTTIANQAESFYTYYGRGIMIERANVKISGITHYVEGEIDHGAPYSGFLHFDLAYNVDVEDCLLTPHFIYYTPSKIPGQMVPMGSYDINVNACVDIHFRRITQTIDINDKNYWGIYGSNFTKNILLEDCNLSRYDAHQGVSGLTIKNCVFGHQGVSIIGYGDAYVENTHVYGRVFFNIRGDYGSVWFGNIIAKNCELTPTFDDYYIVAAHNPGDHDFGYTTKMADSIVLDGFTIHNEGFSATPYIFNNYTNSPITDCPFPYILPDKVTVKNMKSANGKEFEIAPNPELFAKVTIENN